MELTILDRDDGVSYADIPYGRAFMWRDGPSDQYGLYIKPYTSKPQVYHAVAVCSGSAVAFDEPSAKKFVPVSIEQVQVKRV